MPTQTMPACRKRHARTRQRAGARRLRPLATGLLAALCALPAQGTESLALLGWIERVKLLPADLDISAKLDTGADNSSVHAPDAEVFARDGTEWARFAVTNRQGESATFEVPLKGHVTIVSASGSSERPVVEMTICLAGIARTVDVNLADRGDLSYPLLLGRSFMKGRIAVDSARRYIGSPECASDAAGPAARGRT